MKILFVHNMLTSFVRIDLDLLRSVHEVRELAFRPNSVYLKEVIEGVVWCDLVVGWWASWHMLVPVVLAKAQGKAVIVVGGDYDVIYDPFSAQMDGQSRWLRDRLRWQLGRFLFPRIDRFVVNSDYSKVETLKLPFVQPEQISLIYHCLPDLAKGWPRRKKDLALAVGRVSHYDNLLKGWETFVKAAALLPQYCFEMVGIWQDKGIDKLRQLNSSNVNYTGFLPVSELFQKYDAAKAIVQVSYREGFGLTVAEAMLFECAPVVTYRGSLPEVVGDTGLYVSYNDPLGTASAIEEALGRQKELGGRARERILNLFPLEKRRQLMLDLIETIYSQTEHAQSKGTQ
jgi:glycosyltransferase involved in cell wall biosynthesis